MPTPGSAVEAERRRHALNGEVLLKPPEQAQQSSTELILPARHVPGPGGTRAMCPSSVGLESLGMDTQTGRCAGRPLTNQYSGSTEGLTGVGRERSHHQSFHNDQGLTLGFPRRTEAMGAGGKGRKFQQGQPREQRHREETGQLKMPTVICSLIMPAGIFQDPARQPCLVSGSAGLRPRLRATTPTDSTLTLSGLGWKLGIIRNL